MGDNILEPLRELDFSVLCNENYIDRLIITKGRIEKIVKAGVLRFMRLEDNEGNLLSVCYEWKLMKEDEEIIEFKVGDNVEVVGTLTKINNGAHNRYEINAKMIYK